MVRRVGRRRESQRAGRSAGYFQSRRSRRHHRQSLTYAGRIQSQNEHSSPTIGWIELGHKTGRGCGLRRTAVRQQVCKGQMKHAILIGMAALLCGYPAGAYAQRGGRGGQRGGPPVTAKAGAAVDLTGYWVSVVSEDWQFRMITPPKGIYTSVPLNAEGRRIADSWDPAKDEAAGNQCKAYGAAAVMRNPGRLHIAWENDTTLKIDTDAG